MIRVILLLFPLSLFAEVVTTTNLISQDFTDGSWNNPVNSWHSSNDLAGWNGLTHSTSVVYENDDLKSGFDMTTGAEIFHWYSNQTVHITQSVTLDDGSVTSQTKSYLASRGTVHDVANTIIIGSNTSADYELGMSILFEDTRGQVGHYSADVRDPYITLTYDNTPPVQLSDTQVAELKTMSETVYNVVEDIEIIEYIPEEFNFKQYNEPQIEFTMLEEINFEPVAVEEINSGIIDVFMETITYDNQENIESFTTEIEVPEEIPAQREDVAFKQEVYEERETNIQTTDDSRVFESEPVREEASSGNNSEEITRVEDGETPRPSEERVAREPDRESVRENQSVERNSEPEETTVAEANSEETTSSVEPEPARQESNTSTDELVTENDRQDTPDVSIESITKQVDRTTMSVNEKLEQVNILVAKAMQSPVSIDSYASINDNIFNEQLKIDGGNLDEYIQRDYTDSIQISDGDQSLFNDIVVQNQIKVDDAKANVIRSQEHLRKIRGY